MKHIVLITRHFPELILAAMEDAIQQARALDENGRQFVEIADSLLGSGCTARDQQAVTKRDMVFVKGRDYTTSGWGKAVEFHGIEPAVLTEIRNADSVEVRGFATMPRTPINGPFRDDWDLAYDHASLVARYLITNGVRPNRLLIVSGGSAHPAMIDQALVENRVEVVWESQVAPGK